MKIKKILSFALASALSVSLLAGCGGSSDSNTPQTVQGENGKDLQVLRVAVMTGNVDHYATHIGKEHGIFEKYGIELEISEYAYGINTIDAIVNGNADVGDMADFATVNRFGNTQNDTNLKIFAELTSGGDTNGGLYVAPKYADDLKSLDGSEGFATAVGTVTEYQTSLAIDYLGLDESKQHIVNTDSAQSVLALIQQGSISAYVAGGSTAKYIENEGWKLATTAEDLGILTTAYYLSTDQFISQNKELLANYLLALHESVDYVNEHIDESAEYLEKNIGVKAEDFKLNWRNQEFPTEFTEESVTHLEEIQNWAFEHKKYGESYDIRKFIDLSVAKIAFPDNITVKE